MSLEIKDLNITLSSDDPVVENISFQLEKGEMLSIVGSSGAGKTTICKAVMGLLGNAYRAKGSILFHGRELLTLLDRERRTIYGKEICLIMQNPMTAFNPSIRVARQLEKTYQLHHSKTSRKEMYEIFSNLLQRLGLEDTTRILNSYPFTLSGGMLQRVSMACLGGLAPRYILADEPTSALDEENRDHLLTLLRKIYHSAGILFVSHDVSALKMLCRETVILEQGAMIERQNTEALFTHPQQSWTQAFVHAAETRKGGDWSWKAL